MPLIATLTMNPSLDITTSVDRVRPTDKLRTGPLRHDPGGGGINVSRVVHELGGETRAVFPGNGPSAQMIDLLLSEQNVPFEMVPIAQQTRESFTVDETTTSEQYRFVLPGPKLELQEYQACLNTLSAIEPAPQIIVFSGSLPTGTTPKLPRDVCTLVRDMGAKLIVDMSGPLLAEISGAFMIKPNRAELAALAGRELPDADSITVAAREMIARGMSEYIVVSLDAAGAMFISADDARHYPPINVQVASAVGAGDSMVAGIALSITRGEDMHDAMRCGLSAGTAALISPGTNLVARSDYERLLAAYAPAWN